jgi:nicotinamidase/pyrazinamidase
MRINPDTDVLGVIDVQPTFMPGGELPVPDGDAVLPAIGNLLRQFRHAFATQDWHPPGHHSFASAHPGRQPFETVTLDYGPQVLWPDHALQGSPGAALHSALDQARIEAIIRKGFRPEIDSYSGFFENDHRTVTGLNGWMRERGFRRLFLCGLATDFCVAWTAEDAARLGYEVVVVEDACRGIGVPLSYGKTTMDACRVRFAEQGVQIATSDSLVP